MIWIRGIGSLSRRQGDSGSRRKISCGILGVVSCGTVSCGLGMQYGETVGSRMIPALGSAGEGGLSFEIFEPTRG